MKFSTPLRLVACLFMLSFACFSSNAQNFPGNILTDGTGYYGGFELGSASIQMLRGNTDLSVGSSHGTYQIVTQSLSNVQGGGYLSLQPHSGDYMMLIHTDDSRLWYKSVPVTAGQTLNFSACIASAKPKPVTGFEVRLRVKYGSTVAVIASSVAPQGAWSQIKGTFTIPAGVSSVEFQIVDPFPDGSISNFLYLDDLALQTAMLINPDINVTYVGVPVDGNVQTNDAVPSGSSYGVPLPANTNPTTASITINSNGRYTFNAPVKPGVYEYRIPVATPSQVVNCPCSLLTITVLEKGATTNPPVAKTDFGVTKSGMAVTLHTLANDAPGYIGSSLNPSTVSVIAAPKNGTTSIEPSSGNITYVPNSSFAGNDTLYYRVFDKTQPAAMSATAMQIITVTVPGANTTSAADDYVFTAQNTPVSGDAKANDTDPEGDKQTVTAQTVTVAGVGTLVLKSNGKFTFTPVTNFAGPVSFVYTTCDNGTPQACANATIYILVQPVTGLIPLPVRLLSFTAKAQNENVQLTWETAAESNSNHFQIEHSTDGAAWQVIGTVKAAGNSNSKLTYGFVHGSPASGSNYYRLQLVDGDGSRTASSVAVVKMAGGKTVINNTYPNPFQNKVQLVLSSEVASKATMQVLDINGRVMQQREMFVVKGENLLAVDGLEKLNKGAYFIKVTVGGAVLTEKLFK